MTAVAGGMTEEKRLAMGMREEMVQVRWAKGPSHHDAPRSGEAHVEAAFMMFFFAVTKIQELSIHEQWFVIDDS